MKNRMTNEAKVRGGLLLLGLLLLVGAGTAQATPTFMTEYGDQMPWYSAEINAMGGTGTALYRGGFSALYNPAFLAKEAGKRLDAGLALDQSAEDRFQPLYDTFESYVTDVAIAANRNHYWNTGFAFAARVLDGEMPATVGVSLTDRYPFSYKFTEALRSPFIHNDAAERDHILEDRLYEITGTLRMLSLGVGVDINERVSAGVAVNYAFGTRTTTASVSDEHILLGEDDESYRNEEEFELTGVNTTVGLRLQLNERVEVGLAWESQLKVDGDITATSYTAATDFDTTATTQGDYRYPNAYRAGLTFMPRTDPRTTFSVEVEYKPFEEMADSRYPGYDNPRNLADVTDVRVGLEHLFHNGMPIRFGFRYIDTYLDREVSTSAFSAGVGMPVAGGMVSASVELSKLTGYEAHIFGYPGDYHGEAYITEPYATVEDTRFRVGAGYSLQF